MSGDDKRTKLKYETPTIVVLGELARGVGYCAAGSGPGEGYCTAGNLPFTACTAGGAAPAACTGGAGH